VGDIKTSKNFGRKRKGKRPLVIIGVDWSIILKLILRKQGWLAWIGYTWLRMEIGDNSSEHGNGLPVPWNAGNIWTR
jgi:hypothetical protein